MQGGYLGGGCKVGNQGGVRYRCILRGGVQGGYSGGGCKVGNQGV